MAHRFISTAVASFLATIIMVSPITIITNVAVGCIIIAATAATAAAAPVAPAISATDSLAAVSKETGQNRLDVCIRCVLGATRSTNTQLG
eukprot:1987410-Pleurochrysis_carterae.AAC.1